MPSNDNRAEELREILLEAMMPSTGLHMVCPSCQDAGECRSSNPPTTGTVVMCFVCGELLYTVAIIGQLLMLKKADSADLEALGPELAAELQETSKGIKSLNELFTVPEGDGDANDRR